MLRKKLNESNRRRLIKLMKKKQNKKSGNKNEKEGNKNVFTK